MKVFIGSGLISLYALYSFFVYTNGTNEQLTLSLSLPEKQQIDKGKSLFQQYNCISCHQIYGLGGYLGPELTTAYSDPRRGEPFIRAFLQAGGPRMPKFGFSQEEIDALTHYLKYVDATAVTYKVNP